MLQSLHVHNFALIEDAKVTFTPGLNVFTGETGAGKSILIDAFGIVLGARASAGMVRSGTEGFWVQAVFDGAADARIETLLQEQGIEAEESLFLKRQVTASGKSQSSINGVQVPLSVLKKFSSLLVDIHGQHENQALLQPQTPRELVDSFGGQETQNAVAVYKEVYQAFCAAQAKLDALERQGSDRERLLDRLAWEIQEIEAAGLKPGEEEDLRREAKVLQHSGKIMEALHASHTELDREGGALEHLAEVREQLSCALRYDEQLQPLYEEADSAWIAADDLRSRLSDLLDRGGLDEARVVQVQERLDLLYRLQKKYGAGEETVLAYLATAREQYEALQNLEAGISKAKQEVQIAFSHLEKAGTVLTKARKKYAEQLCAGVVRHIRDLAMPDGRFSIGFQAKETFGEIGRDQMEILFSANLGEPLRPLAQVASGGELSRLALALKTVLTDLNSVGTMVFDEIDTGVGGVTAQKMAEKMALIAQRGQVLCITHLPQIAAFADRHIQIRKEAEQGRTVTHLDVLGQAGRVEELMRMTAGDHVTEAARNTAKELLAAAEKCKTQGFDAARQ